MSSNEPPAPVFPGCRCRGTLFEGDLPGCFRSLPRAAEWELWTCGIHLKGKHPENHDLFDPEGLARLHECCLALDDLNLAVAAHVKPSPKCLWRGFFFAPGDAYSGDPTRPILATQKELSDLFAVKMVGKNLSDRKTFFRNWAYFFDNGEGEEGVDVKNLERTKQVTRLLKSVCVPNSVGEFRSSQGQKDPGSMIVGRAQRMVKAKIRKEKIS
jgi:hypothetical protein